MKIWFDILTPKQLLFFESIVNRLEKKHTLLCTSRNYREATELAKIRKIKLDIVGKHGGEKINSKLDEGIKRMQLLSYKIQKFKPDLTISFCSPDASRVSFGLGIPHIGFCNAPHSEAVMRLSVPLLSKLLIPIHMPKSKFTKYGINSKNIFQYKAMDEFLIINNKTIPSKLPKMNLDENKIILFRTYESQASYLPYHTNINKIIDNLLKNFSDCTIIVIGRYTDEIKSLKQKYKNQNLIVLDKVVDSKAILSITDLFIGSGGTMTTEAVLRKIPSISYDAVPNLDEKYLVSKKLLVRAKTPKQITLEATRLLSSNNSNLKQKTTKFISEMIDPYLLLQSTIQSVLNS